MYVDNCIRICSTVLVADIAYRLYACCSEYSKYRNRYLPVQEKHSATSWSQFCRIFNRCFSYSHLWKKCIRIAVIVFVLRSMFSQRNQIVVNDLLYMPLYWVFRLLQLPHSNLDYAKWIRSPYGIDYGEGMASNYFQGYLKLIMSGDRGIRERVAAYSNLQDVEFITDRLVILIPDIMYVDPIIRSDILERSQPLDTVNVNRAGVFRPYKNDVYRFKEKINDKNYYIALEGATPLLSFFEAMNDSYTSTPQMKEMQREILFKFSQSLKKMINDYPGTRNEIDIVVYSANTSNGGHQDVGEVLKAHFEKVLYERSRQRS